MVIIVFGWSYTAFQRRKMSMMKNNFFKENGGFVLQQLLKREEGSSHTNTINIFAADELEKATNGFDKDRVVGQGGFGTVYKGYLKDNCIVAIKKSVIDRNQIQQFINEVLVLFQINQRNVVKLLGCCLETEVPLLVYEFISNGTLSKHLHDKLKATTLSLDIRLKVAAETTGVLSYLHSAAYPPIIHRDIKSVNILLDKNCTDKVLEEERCLAQYFISLVEKGHLFDILDDNIICDEHSWAQTDQQSEEIESLLLGFGYEYSEHSIHIDSVTSNVTLPFPGGR
ncbi:hypothetical protein H5410_045313 [Solanum commersonii]|uniref:Protein kinase domain-containing protein n=1 Tax=Solanum commersonii TaxID=4109 RepID=A0A9J5XB79_SOLCO|nr:hypothetical protein H5410_045313 [Solanum commersonii]